MHACSVLQEQVPFKASAEANAAVLEAAKHQVMTARARKTIASAPSQETTVTCKFTEVPEGVAAAQLFMAYNGCQDLDGDHAMARGREG